MGFLTGRGVGLVDLVVSAALALAAAIACAAAASSCIGLGTSFVEGGALDKLASVRGGKRTGFRVAGTRSAAIPATSTSSSASTSIGALTLFASTALPFPLEALVGALTATLTFLTTAGSRSSSASLISSLSDTRGFDFLVKRFRARLRGWSSLSGVFTRLDWWWRGGLDTSADNGLDEEISMTSGTGGRV